jgi:hypothetical protein
MRTFHFAGDDAYFVFFMNLMIVAMPAVIETLRTAFQESMQVPIYRTGIHKKFFGSLLLINLPPDYRLNKFFFSSTRFSFSSIALIPPILIYNDS